MVSASSLRPRFPMARPGPTIPIIVNNSRFSQHLISALFLPFIINGLGVIPACAKNYGAFTLIIIMRSETS